MSRSYKNLICTVSDDCENEIEENFREDSTALFNIARRIAEVFNFFSRRKNDFSEVIVS